MNAFYSAWADGGVSRAEALRRAQVELMDMTEEQACRAIPGVPSGVRHMMVDGSNPPPGRDGGRAGGRAFSAARHWAAFTLTGDWR